MDFYYLVPAPPHPPAVRSCDSAHRDARGHGLGSSGANALISLALQSRMFSGGVHGACANRSVRTFAGATALAASC